MHPEVVVSPEAEGIVLPITAAPVTAVSSSIRAASA
jgi:hypothetical protein